jgi:putative transposase
MMPVPISPDRLLTFRRRQRRLRHAVNAMLRDIFEILESKDVGELVIGDLTGIREEANHGDKGNQKLHNFWVYNLIAGRIYELGDEYGIAVTKVSERNTSKTCCLCGKQHNGRIERGLIVCKKTHQSINADVNGAVNIMKVAVNRPLTVLSTLSGTSGSRAMADPLLLRWNYNEWL